MSLVFHFLFLVPSLCVFSFICLHYASSISYFLLFSLSHLPVTISTPSFFHYRRLSTLRSTVLFHLSPFPLHSTLSSLPSSSFHSPLSSVSTIPSLPFSTPVSSSLYLFHSSPTPTIIPPPSSSSSALLLQLSLNLRPSITSLPIPLDLSRLVCTCMGEGRESLTPEIINR